MTFAALRFRRQNRKGSVLLVKCYVIIIKTSAPQTAPKERLPFASWLPPQCVSGDEPNIKTEDLSCAVAALWRHWDDARMLSCKMLSTLGSKTHPWSAKDVAAELKAIDGADTKFLAEFIQLVEETEEQQNHLERGLNSERYTLWALLNGQAKPSRGGFSMYLIRPDTSGIAATLGSMVDIRFYYGWMNPSISICWSR